MNNNKFLDLTGLAKYDGLIKAYITSGDDALRAELAAAVEALNAKIGELDGSDDKTLAETIEDIYASIAGIVEAQESLVAKDAEIEGKIAEEIGKIVGTLAEGETAMTLVEVAASLKSLGDRVTANEGEIAGVKERVTAVEEAIKNLGEIEGGESLGEIVSEVKANTAALESLKGDAETVTAAVNKIAKDAADAAQSAAQAYTDSKVDGKFDEAGAAAQALADAQAYTDSKVDGKFDEAGAAAQALADAQAYVDGKVDGKFDEAGAAAAAQAAAEAYADGLAGNYDAAGTAAGFNAAMDTRMTGVEGDVAALKAIDHDKLVSDAIAAVVAGAESDFDTLKEVADWIAADTTGSAELQATVSGHSESINTINGELDALELKVDGDIANLTTHMTEAAAKIEEVDGRLAALDAFVEAHDRIPDSDIECLFSENVTE